MDHAPRSLRLTPSSLRTLLSAGLLLTFLLVPPTWAGGDGSFSDQTVASGLIAS